MDYFSRKPDFPTFEDIYIARAQGAIGLERREDGLACRFGPPPACIARRDQPGRPLRIARKRAPFLPWRRAEAGAGVLQAGEG